jgi:rRNA maturation endonuclease Nob1
MSAPKMVVYLHYCAACSVFWSAPREKECPACGSYDVAVRVSYRAVRLRIARTLKSRKRRPGHDGGVEGGERV